MNKQRGFTVIELLVVTVLLIVLGALFWIQKNNIEAANRDDDRRTAINAMYYNLEEVYYPEHKSYPKTINGDVLKAMDEALFTDPNGIKLGDAGSDYRYEPVGCQGDKCTGYTLRSALENEADFVKSSRRG